MQTDLARESFRCVAVDRPGYGETLSTKRVGYVDQQVEVLSRFLNDWANPDLPLCIVGHSYGAVVAATLARVLKEKLSISGMVLVAGVIDSSRQHSRWYHSLMELPMVKWFLGKGRRRSVLEMKRVVPALESLAEYWSNVSMPVQLIHGSDDWIVDFENSEYAYQEVGDEYAILHRIEAAGHDLPQSHPEMIAKSVAGVFEFCRKGALAQ